MVTIPEQPVFCAQCGTQLRRGKPAGARCDVCERAEPVRLVLPDGYYDTEEMCRILGSHDFGALFRRLRADHGLSQQDLATLTGLSQRYISDIERGQRDMQYIRTVAPVSTRLGIPGIRLGFGGRATVRRTVSGWKDDPMFRRNFVGTAAGLTLGIATGLDIDRLLALLPGAEPAGARRVRRIGVADVQVIEQLTAEFVRQDFAHGGGLIQAAAIEQLRTTLPLLDAEMSPGLRPRLMLAAGRLAMEAGWISFDCADHVAARRLWLVGLGIARHTEHPQANDLTVFLLSDMTMQAAHLDRLDEALRFVQIGEATAHGGHPVSAATMCHLMDTQARANAAQGDAKVCDRALGAAEDHFTRIDPAATPPWAAFLDEIHLSSFEGDAHYALALHGADARTAGRAVELLHGAVDHLGPEYARTRAVRLPRLAGAHALARDIDTAVSIGHEAVDAVSAVSSARAVDGLRTLHGVLEPMQGSPGVTELRDRLITVTAA